MEFLYLGTLLNPQGLSGEIATPKSSNASAKISVLLGLSSTSAYQKLGSSELKPLLPHHNFRQRSRNSVVETTMTIMEMAEEKKKFLKVTPFEYAWSENLMFRKAERGCVAFKGFAHNDVTVVFRENVGVATL
ncbi:uncharacterized protein J3R85_003440 [Psidium guajava]|nr:uncharacterized protein J3R85_003440 [Psidium guajava]